MTNPFAGTSSIDHGGYGTGIGGAALGMGGMRGSDFFEGGASTGTAVLGMIKQTAGLVGSTTGPIGGMASAGIGVVCDSITDGIGAWDTQKTVAELKRILSSLGSTGKSGNEAEQLREILTYAIGKKTSLRDRKIASATVVAKIGVQGFNAGKFISKKIKGTQGVNRGAMATQLQSLAGNAADPMVKRHALATIVALTKMNMEGMVKNALQESLRSS